MAVSHPRGKYFFLKTGANSNLVMDIRDSQDKPGTDVITGEIRSDLDGNEGQLWYMDTRTQTIRSCLNGFCLDLNADRLVVNPFQRDKSTQQWQYSDQRIQQQEDFELVLSVFEDTADPGASIYVQQDDGRSGQEWTLEHSPAQYFYIRAQEKPSMVLDVRGANPKPGAQVLVYQDKGKMADNQLWYEDQQGLIRSKLNGFTMDASGKEVILLPYDVSNPRMQWVISGNTLTCRQAPSEVLMGKKGKFFKDAALVAGEYDGSPEQHWSFDYIPNQALSLNHAGNGKHFFLRNRWCGLVMEVHNALGDPGSEVTTAYRTPSASMGDHQLFYEEDITGTIRSAINGYCLDIQDDVIVINPYDPYSKDQMWRKFGRKVQNRSNLNQVLQVAEASMDPGANIVVEDFTGDDEQLWETVHVPAKLFYITSLMHGKVVDVRGDKAVPGVKVIMYEKKGGMAANQLWYEDERGIVRSKLNGFALDSSKDRVVLNPYDPSNPHHQWIIVGDRVQNRVDSKYVLDIEKESTKNSASVCSYKFHGGDNQRWKFEYI